MSFVWSLVFAVSFAIVYLVIAVIASTRFSGISAYGSFAVPGWVFGILAAVASLGFILGLSGKLPGTK